ncbi:unnamed protein product [Pylaiella littoralis]
MMARSMGMQMVPANSSGCYPPVGASPALANQVFGGVNAVPLAGGLMSPQGGFIHAFAMSNTSFVSVVRVADCSFLGYRPPPQPRSDCERLRFKLHFNRQKAGVRGCLYADELWPLHTCLNGVLCVSFLYR